MTTQHLEKIKAKCFSLLALAEKRTPGKWIHRECARMQICADTLHQDSVIYGDEFELSGVDGDFIAACAGTAEAGWSSTIAAIEGLQRVIQLLRDEEDIALSMAVETQLNLIIAAWPEETL